jgi:biotin operon repressor
MNQQALLEFLKLNCLGRDNAVTGKELQLLFGCSDIREIQKAIERLRRNGSPILSVDQGDRKGYFWPSDPSEAIETYRQMSRRAANTYRTLRNIKDGIEREFGIEQLQIQEFKEVSGL